MSGITEKVFSEVEAREIAVKIEGATEADTNECVGSWEEEMDCKTVVKKCRGVVTKSRTKGTGTGVIKAKLHMQQDLFADMYGMQSKELKDGVIAYGTSSLHPIACVTVKVLDEDDNEKLKAYPKCTIQKALSRKVENGTEEVAEIELELAVMPDENGFGLYEAVVSDLTDEELKTKWMKEFTPELVQAIKA